jgi:hypothetical protein
MTLVEDVDDQVFIHQLPESSTAFSSSTRLFNGQTTIRGLLQRHEDMHRLVEDRDVVGEAQLSESVNRSPEVDLFVEEIKEIARSNCRNFAGTVPRDKRKIPQKNDDDDGRMISEEVIKVKVERKGMWMLNAGGEVGAEHGE